MDRETNALILRIAGGDKKALESLYLSQKAGVFSFCLSLLRDRTLAEDAVQETFLKAWVSAPAQNPNRDGKAWLYSIAHNLCIDMLRQRNKTVPEDAEALPDEGFDLCGTEDCLLLREALSALEAQSCHIMLLHAVAGFKFREIAALLGLRRSEVEWKYYSAVKALAKSYGRNETEFEKSHSRKTTGGTLTHDQTEI